MNGEMRTFIFMAPFAYPTFKSRAELLPLMGYILEHTLNQLYA